MANNENEQEKTEKKFSEEELETFARRPDLLRFIRKDLDHFIVGEERNKLLLFMICASKIQREPLGAVVTGGSSAGKNTVVDKVTQYFDRVRSFSRITPASLDRLQQDLSNSILVLRELGGLQSQPALRVMLSEGGLRLLTTNERNEVIEIETRGRPVFLTTTTWYEIEKQLQNRILIISLDETEEQTRHIIRFEAGDLELQDCQPVEPNPLIKQYLNILQPYKVAVPYAKILAEAFPANSISARRDFKKLGTLIRISAILHQFQRRKVQDSNNKTRFFILADKIDFEYALTIGGKSLEQTLAGIQKRSIQALEAFKKNPEMTSAELGKTLHLSTRRARDRANALVNAGYVNKDESQKIHVFTLRETPDVDLEKLRNPLVDWNEERLQMWFQENRLRIVEKASEQEYINPFFACKISVSATSSNEDNQAIIETASKHQAETPIAESPSVTHDADTEIQRAEAQATTCWICRKPLPKDLKWCTVEEGKQCHITCMRLRAERLERRETEAPKNYHEKVEPRLLKNLPPVFSPDDLINECVKTGRTKQDCELLWASLIQDGLIIELPEGVYQCRR